MEKHAQILSTDEIKWAKRAMWAPSIIEKDGKYYSFFGANDIQTNEMLGGIGVAVSDSPAGPFKRIARVLQQDPKAATGAGHHSVIHVPNSDDYYAVYHRRALNETDGNSRVTCTDQMTFDKDGFIQPIKITDEAVAARLLKPASR